MGNETSQLRGLKIDRKAIEVTDHYNLNLGEIPKVEVGSKGSNSHKKKEASKDKNPNGSKNQPQKQVYAIFSCDSAVGNSFEVDKQLPLARAIKCMKIYR